MARFGAAWAVLLLALAAFIAAPGGAAAQRLGCAGCRALAEDEQACPVLLDTSEWLCRLCARSLGARERAGRSVGPPAAHPPPLPPF